MLFCRIPLLLAAALAASATLGPPVQAAAQAQAAGPALAQAAGPALAQAAGPASAPIATPAPSFDVASIHLSPPSSDGHHHIWNDVHQSQFRTGNLSVRDLIQYAWNLPESQVLGGPDWLDSAMFDVDAKSDAAVDARLHALNSDDAAQQKRLMVQALLADRFQLRAHQETRQLPVFALVVANAKAGPKFQPNNRVGNSIDTGRNRLHVSGMTNTVPVLARELAQVLGRVVVDRTGITGSYNLTLRWTPDDAAPPMLNGAPDPNAPPGIFTAIQEQLGLKLESSKGPVPVLVIDHVEKPSEN